MKAHIRVTVHAGPRTKTSVEAYCTGVNVKKFTLANGKIVTDVEMAKWIAENLQKAIDELGGITEETNDARH